LGSQGAVDNQGCCLIQSPQAKKITIGVASITALVSAILIGLGAAGILPPVGNLPAMVAGGVFLAVSIAVIIFSLCMKNRQEAPQSSVETDEQEEERKRQARIKNALLMISSFPTINRTLLWGTVSLKSIEAFKAAIDKILSDPPNLNAILNTRDPRGCTLWHHIALHGTPEMLSYLYEKKIPFTDETSKYGDGVFHWAVRGNNPGVIPQFVHLGADINKLDTNSTPLHNAAAWGKLECVKALIEAGASIDIKNNAGDTVPAHWRKHNYGTRDCQAVALYLAQKFPACKTELGVKR
jgi:hypothetical protein